MATAALGAQLQEIRQRAQLFLAERTQHEVTDREFEQRHAIYMNKVFEAKEIKAKRDIECNEIWKDLKEEEDQCREQIRVAALWEMEQQAKILAPPAAMPINRGPSHPGSTRRGAGSADPVPPAAEEESGDDS